MLQYKMKLTAARLLLLLLVLVGAAVQSTESKPLRAQAISGAATTPPTIRQAVRGTKTRYVDDFVTHGTGNPSNPNYDWRPVFQAAHDAVAADIDAEGSAGQQWAGTVMIRGKTKPYLVSGPVYIWHYNVVVQGEGNATFILAGNLNGNMGCPVFLMGWPTPQSCGGQFLANFASYRPDCFNKVDNTLATAAGQRWGFRSQGQSFVQAQGTPFSHGALSSKFGAPYVDNWAETQTLTIEFIVEGFNGSPGMLAANGAPGSTNTLFGVTDNNQVACPYWMVMNGANFELFYMTQAIRGGPASAHTIVFPQAAAGGVQRVTIQIDHVAGKLTAWVNGIQAVTTTVPTGVFLNENFQFPFGIANGGSYGMSGGPFLDFALYGLSMSKTLRYNVSTNGSGQVRTAGTTAYASLTDLYRYGDDSTDRGDGGATSGLIGYFKFTENPATLDMMMGIQCGPSINFSAPAFLSHPQQNNLGGIGGQGVRDIHLLSNRSYSTPLMHGRLLPTAFQNLLLEGGLWGAASGLGGSSYTLHFTNCTFSGSDAAIFGLFTINSLTDCNINRGGRNTLLFVQSNVYTSGHTFIAGAQAPCQTSVGNFIGGGDGGGQISLTNILQDVEGAPYPSVAGIKIQRNHAGGNIKLDQIVCGAMIAVPAIILDDFSGNGGFLDNYIEISRVSAAPGTQPSFLQVNGNGFYGKVDDLVFGQSPPIYCTNQYSPGSSLQIASIGYPAPPHWGTHYAGVESYKVNTPADGLYRLWECSRTGTCGSTTPPSFVGSKAYQSTPQALAAVALDHTSIATTAYGGSSYGWFSDTMTADALGYLFGQTAGFGGSITSLQFHLTTTTTYKNGGNYTEATGGNYAPVSLTNHTTNFPASSAGTKSNGTAIIWPTLTFAINGVAGVYVTDQSGRVLAYVQFTTPQNFAIGATPTIGVGALTFTQLPTNTPGFLTQYGWGRIVDRYFGGSAITPPATWYVGLNTAHAAPATTPTEPSGNGYARAALTNSTAYWGPRLTTAYVMTSNLQVPIFPAPTGSGWGTILGAPIFDAATGGNCWWTADAPNAVPAGAGLTPTIGVGALLLSL